MRLEAEGQAPAQRTEAVRRLDQHGNAANLVAEAAGDALIVLLGDLGAILEPLRDILVAECRDQGDRGRGGGDEGEGDDAAPQPCRGARAMHEPDHGYGGDHRGGPGSARERQEDAGRDDGERGDGEHGHLRAPADQVVQKIKHRRDQE